MTIFELGALGEFVGSLAVIVTLMYLAAQIRHNTSGLRSATLSAISERQQFELRWSSDIREAFSKSVSDPASLTAEETWSLTEWHNAAFLARQNEYLHYRQGLIEEEIWLQSERIIGFILGTDWAMGWWDRIGKQTFSPEFTKLMDKIIREKTDLDMGHLYDVSGRDR